MDIQRKSCRPFPNDIGCIQVKSNHPFPDDIDNSLPNGLWGFFQDNTRFFSFITWISVRVRICLSHQTPQLNSHVPFLQNFSSRFQITSLVTSSQPPHTHTRTTFFIHTLITLLIPPRQTTCSLRVKNFHCTYSALLCPNGCNSVMCLFPCVSLTPCDIVDHAHCIYILI